jgi:hypothetical protein
MEIYTRDEYLNNANLWQIVRDYILTSEQQNVLQYAISRRNEAPKLLLLGPPSTGKTYIQSEIVKFWQKSKIAYISGHHQVPQTLIISDACASIFSSNRTKETYGYKTFKFYTRFNVIFTTNQLVLGTTNTATISATAPSATSRTYTLPDPSADASFVMVAREQTIPGSKTFSSHF